MLFYNVRGRPEIPLLVTQGTWIRQIAKPLDSDILERLAEAVSDCWRLICNICVGVTLGVLFWEGREGGGGSEEGFPQGSY